MTLQLRNPHSVLAILDQRPQDVVQVVLPQAVSARGVKLESLGDDPWSRVAKIAREHRIPVQSGGAVGVRSQKGAEGGRAGTAEATVKEREPLPIEQLFKGARERADGKGLWIALDCLQDPHNVGAVFRTAAFFGVQGILMTQERSAPLTAAAYDVASGGMEYVPYSQPVNLQRAFEIAKDQGLWILGTSEHAQDNFFKIERDRPWLLVMGNEEKGMRRLTEEACDLLCKVPSAGGVTSLNVSVAAGIFISRLCVG